MKDEELKKLAEQKAGEHEKLGSPEWYVFYFGFIIGWQACEKNAKKVSKKRKVKTKPL